VSGPSWHALILAAGRGPSDSMAKAYGVSHKCLLPVGGVPMLRRVVETLAQSRSIDGIEISIEDGSIAQAALSDLAARFEIVPSRESAARSAIAALERNGSFPCLVTTGDHPLLTTEIVTHFLEEAARSQAELCAGLASRRIIEAAFPDATRTYIRFADAEVSGCNLFALASARALAALDFWHYLEPVRKKPWRLARAFGLVPFIRFATRTLTLEEAFASASRRLKLSVRPILLPFPEAAIDVDKPADKELAEKVLAERR
jgi:CTP:molybdopterin cytidylyltransferase MocA